MMYAITELFLQRLTCMQVVTEELNKIVRKLLENTLAQEQKNRLAHPQCETSDNMLIWGKAYVFYCLVSYNTFR
jgi:hypothetical protein